MAQTPLPSPLLVRSKRLCWALLSAVAVARFKEAQLTAVQTCKAALLGSDCLLWIGDCKGHTPRVLSTAAPSGQTLIHRGLSGGVLLPAGSQSGLLPSL